MTDRLPTLDLFGAVHLDRHAKVETELDAFVAGDGLDGDTDEPTAVEPTADEPPSDGPAPDDGDGRPLESLAVEAVFVEYPAAVDGNREWSTWLASSVLARPTQTIGAATYALATLPFLLLSTRRFLTPEVAAAEQLSEERSLDRHSVDVLWPDRAAGGTWRWYGANWIALLVALWLAPTGTLATGGAVVLGWIGLSVCDHVGPRATLVAGLPVAFGPVVALIALGPPYFSAVPIVTGLFVFVGIAALTLDDRNRHMLDRVEEVAAEEGYDRACLVTGAAHVPGMVRRIADGDHDLGVGRTYRPRWLRAPGTIDTEPTPESDHERVGRPEPASVPSGGAVDDVLGRRVGAALLDGFLVVVCWFPASVAGGVLAGTIAGSDAIGYGVGATLLTWPLVYELLSEGWFGRTPGKRFFGLVVVGADGTPATISGVLVRALVRPVDLVIGWVLLLANEDAQRLGDRLAGTVVVSTEGESSS